MNLVQQKDDKSCTSACLSMLTGIPYDAVFETFSEGWHEHNYTPDKFLDDHGVTYVLNSSPYNTTLWHGGVYLLTVPSLNYDGALHHIIADYREEELKILDPNQGREGYRHYVAHEPNNPSEVFIKFWLLDMKVNVPAEADSPKRPPVDKLKREEDILQYEEELADALEEEHAKHIQRS